MAAGGPFVCREMWTLGYFDPSILKSNSRKIFEPKGSPDPVMFTLQYLVWVSPKTSLMIFCWIIFLRSYAGPSVIYILVARQLGHDRLQDGS